MATENDVPLGDGARRYYEQQFGERIRQVNKGGSRSNGAPSNSGARTGCGVVILIFLAIRIFSALLRSSPSAPTIREMPPPLPPAIHQKAPWERDKRAPRPWDAPKPNNPFNEEQDKPANP